MIGEIVSLKSSRRWSFCRRMAYSWCWQWCSIHM